MSFIFNYYARALQTNPIAANVGTSLVLMTTGDVMAQKIEKYQMQQTVFDADGRNKEEEEMIKKMPLNRRVSLRRYMSKMPTPIEHSNKKHDDRNGNKNDEDVEIRRRVLIKEKEELDVWMEKMKMVIDRIQNEANDIDWVRSSSLGLWAACIMTPGFMTLFKSFDIVLGTIKTPLTTGIRLVGCFLWSIPNNAAFFAYGTCVHHTLEWWDGNKTQVLRLKSSQSHDAFDSHPDPTNFNFDEMIIKAKMKIEAEIETTVKNSAKVWVPVNFINFTFVPPHLRQLVMNGTSVFWNCYISLVQHRDIITREDVMIYSDQ